MTAKLHENLVMGETASEDGLGFIATRKIVVSELSYGIECRPGGLTVNKDNLLNAAINFINWLEIWNGFPVNFKLGGPHSGIPNCYLESRNPRALSKDVVEIDLQYRGFNVIQPAKISFQGGMEPKETNRGLYWNGSSFATTKTDMYVEHAGTKTGMSASVGVPTIQIVAEQNEIKEFLAMKQHIQTYQGTLNNETFLDDAPGSWLCNEIQASRVYAYSGSSWGYYAVRYVLTKLCSSFGWDFEGLYLTEKGRPPDVVTYGTERRRYQVLDTMSWSNIGIRGITV